MEEKTEKAQVETATAQEKEKEVNENENNLQYLVEDEIKKEARKTDERSLIQSYWTGVGRRNIVPIAISDEAVRYAFMPSLHKDRPRLKIELFTETRVGKATDTSIGKAVLDWWKSCVKTETEEDLIMRAVNSDEVEERVDSLLKLLQDESLTPFSLLHDEDRSQYTNANLKLGARIGLLAEILASRKSFVTIRASVEEPQNWKIKLGSETQTQQLSCYSNSSPGGKGYNTYVIADVLTSCLLADSFCDGDYGEDIVNQIIDSLDVSESLKSLMKKSKTRSLERMSSRSGDTVKHQHVCILFAAVAVIELMQSCGIIDVQKMVADPDIEVKARSEQADRRKLLEVLYQSPGSTGVAAQFGTDPLAGVMRYSYIPNLLFSGTNTPSSNSQTTVLFDLTADPSPDSVEEVSRILLATMYYLMRVESQPSHDRTSAAERVRNSLVTASAQALDLLYSDATNEEKEAELEHIDIVKRNLSIYEPINSSDKTRETTSEVRAPVDRFAGLELDMATIKAQLEEITAAVEKSQSSNATEVERSGKSSSNEEKNPTDAAGASGDTERDVTDERSPTSLVIPLVTTLAILTALR